MKLSRYAKIEIAFFVVVFFAFPILTDMEYVMNESPCANCDDPFWTGVLERVIWGFWHIPPYLLFYHVMLKKLLLRKRYIAFLVTLVLFFFGLEVYTKYGMYWPISKLTFLPDIITNRTNRYFHAKPFFHFSVVYIVKEMLVFTALAYFINSAKQEKQLHVLKEARLEADLNYLKAQLQPHFFFNTLNNIYSLALQQSTHTAPLVAKLSEMMRYVLYDTNHGKVPLEQEVNFLSNYVAVQSVRYNEKIAISFDTQGIDGNASIEPLLLLPFIENTFKHGVEEEMREGFIDIVVCLIDNELTLSAKNSKAVKSGVVVTPSGIGLANTEKRLALLYPDKHTLEVSETPTTYTLLLTICLN
jgi:sensor histidine kinase YesM